MDTSDSMHEDPVELSLTEIYNQLLITNELILTIPAEEEQPLRRGLAMVKSKQTTRLKEAGMPVDRLVLQYHVTPHKDSAGKEVEGVVTVHITLAARSAITVLSMKVPDPGI